MDVRVGLWRKLSAPKNRCFWTVVLEKTLESPLDCKEIQSVHSEGDQPWDFFGRTDAKAETPVLWPPHAKSWLIEEDSDAGRDWGQEEKGTTEDEMAGWHHWLDGRESEWTPGVGDGQGGLACCDSWGRKESDTTKRLNGTELNWTEWLLHAIWSQHRSQHNTVKIKNNYNLKKKFKVHGSRTSLVAQRLRLHLSTAEGIGLIPGPGTKIPHATECGHK